MRELKGYMNGVNLGGWLSQNESDLDSHFSNFITEDDIIRIKEAGFDHVRLPVDYNNIEDEEGNPKEEGILHVDDCVSWCRKHKMNLILDLHKTFGYSFDPLDRNQDKEAFFYDEKLQERFYKIWDRLSKRYSKDTDIMVFELLNEIVSYDVAAAWNKVAAKAVEVIRKNTPDVYIIIGGVCYNSVIGVPLLDKPADDKIVYTFHFYEPLVFTHQRAYWVDNMPEDMFLDYPGNMEDYKEKSMVLDPNLAAAIMKGDISGMGEEYFEKTVSLAIEAADKYDAPLYCGEYGVINLAPIDSAKRWFADIRAVFKRHGIGSAIWTYKEKDFGTTFEECFMK